MHLRDFNYAYASYDVCPERIIKVCPVCGKENPEEFYFNDYCEEYVGCSDCVSGTEWGDYIE